MQNHRPRVPRIRIFLSVLSAYFALTLFARPLSGQERPADSAEISRDLLFLAPLSGEIHGDGAARAPRFYAGRLAYDYSASGGWVIAPHDGAQARFEIAPKGRRIVTAGGVQYTLAAHSDDDRATLEILRTGDAEPIVTAFLWNREHLAGAWLPFLSPQHKGLTLAALQQDLEVGDPILYDVAVSGDSVWVAVGHSIGEGELGLGTVVRFDVTEKKAKVFQPKELATCAVTVLALAQEGSVWLGTRRQYEGTVQPCTGLVRLDSATGIAQTVAPSGTPLADSVPMAMVLSDLLWVATDAGICGMNADGSWNCWSIMPTVTIRKQTALTNKPGEKSGSSIKPGEYEVLWANAGFLELATKDSYDAWLAADDFAEAAVRNFDTEPYKLLNTSTGPAPIRPLAKPGGEALEGALVYRVPLEKLPVPEGTPAGWIKVRVRAGWIPRGDLQIAPKFVPVE